MRLLFVLAGCGARRSGSDFGFRISNLFIGLGLDGAVVGLGFAEVFRGVFGRFFGVGAGLGDIGSAFAVQTDLVARHHVLPPFRFSIRANSCSICC